MAANSKSTRNWADLPTDVTANILHRVGAIEILENAQKVCTNWHKICKDPAMWRVIDMNNRDEYSQIDLEKMCMHAVDRSQGQLIDITIAFFGTSKLIRYIADRSSQLKRVQLVCCDVRSGLKKAVKKLPLLEEVHLICTWISKETIQSIGRSCPLLKSFKLETKSFTNVDEGVKAIAKNMPGLRHLSLFGRELSDTGLQSILDGCPLLISLDLRLCKIDSKGDLLKRCLGHIKDLKSPSDSTDDYMFNDPIYREPDSDDDYCCNCGDWRGDLSVDATPAPAPTPVDDDEGFNLFSVPAHDDDDEDDDDDLGFDLFAERND